MCFIPYLLGCMASAHGGFEFPPPYINATSAMIPCAAPDVCVGGTGVSRGLLSSASG